MTDTPIVYPGRAGSSRVAGLALAALAVALLSVPTHGAMAAGKPGQLIETSPAQPVPELTMTDLSEQPATLAAYRGKPLIVNLWATWCGPCIKEMPSLMRLQAAMKDQGLAVIAVSEDRGGKFVVDPFLKDHNIADLPIYLDKSMQETKLLRAGVMPTTVLIDADGREVGRVFGEREWDSPASKAEIAKLFGLKASG